MNFFKMAVLLSMLLLLSATTFADVGPSPSYSFSISNTADHPDYSFYYSGNIWPDQLLPITGSTGVYKFNNTIRVYAVPNPELSAEDVDLLKERAVKSQQINLASGHTTFEVASFNAQDKTMHLQETGRDPDTDYGFEFLLYYIILPIVIISVPLLIPIIIIAVLIIAVVLFLLKRPGVKK